MLSEQTINENCKKFLESIRDMAEYILELEAPYTFEHMKSLQSADDTLGWIYDEQKENHD